MLQLLGSLSGSGGRAELLLDAWWGRERMDVAAELALLVLLCPVGLTPALNPPQVLPGTDPLPSLSAEVCW